MQQIANAWKDDPETLPMLKDLAQYCNDSNVRLEAGRQLATYWKNNPETSRGDKPLAFLRNAVQTARGTDNIMSVGIVCVKVRVDIYKKFEFFSCS